MSLKDDIANIGKAALAGALAVGIAASPAEAYPNVNVRNNTPYRVEGRVTYVGCKDDSYGVDKGGLWTAKNRGFLSWCLVTGVTADVEEPSGTVNADSYGSSGTGYSKFQVVKKDTGGYKVNRP